MLEVCFAFVDLDQVLQGDDPVLYRWSVDDPPPAVVDELDFKHLHLLVRAPYLPLVHKVKDAKQPPDPVVAGQGAVVWTNYLGVAE